MTYQLCRMSLQLHDVTDNWECLGWTNLEGKWQWDAGQCATIKRADGAASSRAMLLHWDEAGAGYIGDENCEY